MVEPSAPKAWHRRWPIQGGALLALAVGVFATALFVPFLAWDDPYYVVQNARIHRPGWNGLLNLWTFTDFWRGKRILEYFPLRDSIYWLLWHSVGNDPLPFHAVNVAAHAVCSVLVWRLALRLGFSGTVSWGAAALFAVHPIHVESVAWVAGLKDPLFTALMLGSLIAYLRHRETGRAGDYAAFLGLLVLSLLAKSFAICMPLMILAIERCSAHPTRWTTALARATPPALISGVFFILFVFVARTAGVLVGPHGGHWSSHFFYAGWAMVRYIRQAIIPASFSIQPCFYPPEGLTDLRLPAMAVVLAAGVALALWGRRRSPPALLLMACFFIPLLPVANLMPFPAIMADRYLYLPSMATCIGTAWLMSRLPGRAPWLTLGATLLIFGGVTAVRGVVWQKEVDLWQEAISDAACMKDTQPHSGVAFIKYSGLEPNPPARFEAAEDAIAHPSFPKLDPETQCSFLIFAVSAAQDVGMHDRAMEWARRLSRTCAWRSSSWSTLTKAIWNVDPKAAADAARRAYRLRPEADLLYTFGAARFAAGEPSGAEQIAEAVVQSPATLCRSFEQWLARVNPEDPSILQEARRACQRK